MTSKNERCVSEQSLVTREFNEFNNNSLNNLTKEIHKINKMYFHGLDNERNWEYRCEKYDEGLKRIGVGWETLGTSGGCKEGSTPYGVAQSSCSHRPKLQVVEQK